MSPNHPTVQLDPIPSLPGYLACRLGIIYTEKNGRNGLKPPRPLAHRQDKDGYLIVRVSVNGKYSNLKVHRLILETYVGSCPEGMECLHGPGGRPDNSIGNLHWGTKQENINDRGRDGNTVCGSKHKLSRLNESDIPIIRNMRPCDAAREFKITRQQASKIKRRLQWNHIP